MSEPSLESLFERYRSRGDLAALAAVFDRTAPELLTLAVHLVRDPVEGEDLVQATFLAAIEGARSFDAARRLEPWLAGILARQAARAQRERSRRPDARRLERAPEPDPARRAEERELAGELQRALERLDEPQRALLEQYLAGERALDIARRAGSAPGTVRMQILRGLERLRRVLPAGLLGVFPLRAPRGIAAVRAEVLAQGGLAGAATLTTASFLGGLLVSSKALAAGLAALALVLLVWWRAPRTPALVPLAASAPAAAPRASPRFDASAPEALLAARAAQVEREASAPLPEVAPSAATRPAVHAGGVWLVGRLLGLEGARTEQTEIAVTTFQGPNTGGTGTSDGRYALDLTPLLASDQEPLGAIYVTATHPLQRKTSVEFPLPAAVYQTSGDERLELTLDLDLSPRTVLVGRVAPDDGFEPDSVIIGLVGLPEPAVDGHVGTFTEVNCETDGRFRIYTEGSGRFLLVAHTWGVPPITVDVQVPEGEVTDVGTLHLESGGVAIEGELVLPFDVPRYRFRIRAARVEDERAGLTSLGWEGLAMRDSRFEAVEQLGKVHVDGRFRIEGLSPGTYTLALERDQSDHVVLPFPAATVVAPASEISFGEHYGRVRILVTSTSGDCAGARLDFELDEHGSVRSDVTCGEPVQVIVDRRAPLVLQATAPGAKSARQELPADTRAVEEELALELRPDEEGATLLLQWSASAALEELPGLTQLTARLHPEGYERFASVASGARCAAFHDLVPGRYDVMLEPRGKESWTVLASYACAAPLEVELFAGQTTRVTMDWLVGGRARFVPGTVARSGNLEDFRALVLDAWDRSLPMRFVTRSYSEGVMSFGARGGSIPLQQPSELEPSLPPGSYTLVLHENDAEVLRVPFTLTAGETVEVPFDLP